MTVGSVETARDDASPLMSALDELTAANRARRDPRVEQLLVELRQLAADELREQAGDPPPTVEVVDPFPDIDGVPDIEATDLDVATMTGAVHHHGSLIVRGMFDHQQVDQLRHIIDASLGAVEQRQADKNEALEDPWFRPLGRFMPVYGAGREWLSVQDSPRAMFEVTEMFRAVIGELVLEHLGERPLMRGSKWTLRRITPDCVGEWHQDGYFLGPDIRVINIWAALTRCGGGTPAAGFELLDRPSGLLPTDTEGAGTEFSIGAPVVEGIAGREAIIDPIYEPGDAVIFDQLTVHRTGSRPGLTEPRYAIESWFFGASTYPEDSPSVAFCF